MSYTKSTVLAVPAEYRDACNRLMEAYGRGPGTFIVAAVAAGTNDVVSYWAHTFDDDLVASFEDYTIPRGVTADDLAKHGFDEESALNTVRNVRYRALGGVEGRTNFIECMKSEGVEPQGEPQPEKGLLARIGSAIMSFFAPTDLEGQI